MAFMRGTNPFAVLQNDEVSGPRSQLRRPTRGTTTYTSATNTPVGDDKPGSLKLLPTSNTTCDNFPIALHPSSTHGMSWSSNVWKFSALAHKDPLLKSDVLPSICVPSLPWAVDCSTLQPPEAPRCDNQPATHPRAAADLVNENKSGGGAVSLPSKDSREASSTNWRDRPDPSPQSEKDFNTCPKFAPFSEPLASTVDVMPSKTMPQAPGFLSGETRRRKGETRGREDLAQPKVRDAHGLGQDFLPVPLLDAFRGHGQRTITFSHLGSLIPPERRPYGEGLPRKNLKDYLTAAKERNIVNFEPKAFDNGNCLITLQVEYDWIFALSNVVVQSTKRSRYHDNTRIGSDMDRISSNQSNRKSDVPRQNPVVTDNNPPLALFCQCCHCEGHPPSPVTCDPTHPHPLEEQMSTRRPTYEHEQPLTSRRQRYSTGPRNTRESRRRRHSARLQNQPRGPPPDLSASSGWHKRNVHRLPTLS